MSTEAIATVGGLWSAQILDALRDDPTRLSDTDPTDYGLPPRYQLREATRHGWGLLGAAWADFDRLYEARVEAEGEEYGDDRFTIDRWLTHLWQQLGYGDAERCPVGLVVDDGDEHDPVDRYPIDLLWHDRIPILQVAAGTPLDRVNTSATGGARRSPHAAMQDYLNRTSRHLWGIVTNGLTLRLLRNNSALTRQAYVEFDLAEIFRDDNFPSFAVLWLALHSTRFDGPKPTDSPAERWQNHALDTGVRALTTLRQGVENAILTLGHALIDHTDNQALRNALTAGDIDGQDLYRELLYVAYRHVFLFAVEDRDLLHPPDADPDAVGRYRNHYSTARLREQARRHTGGSHPDGWAAFQTLTRMLADPAGQPLLALPPLLGALWDAESTPHLNETTVPNRAYYEAVRSLAFVRQDGLTHRIDYRNLGAEELGAVYESLLELIIDVSPTERKFTKREAAGSDRKTTGSYYTPTSLITRVLQDALDPVIDQAVKGLDGTEAADAILNLTVCDPAMGSGHFLVAAAHRLAKQVAAHRTGNLEPDPVDYRQALRDVTSRCIYGVDLNPMAVELAKISLWLECHVPGQPLTFLDHHLKCGNALLGVGFDRGLIDWQPRSDDGTPENGGVPDVAFKAITGDDTALVKSLRSANKASRSGSVGLLGAAELHEFPLDELSGEVRGIAWMDDTTPEGLAAKQRAWMVYGETDELRRERLKADAWTACWTIPKTHDRIDQTDRPHDVYYDTHYNGLPSDARPGVIASRHESERLRFFHWYIEFPDIADAGGFSCLLANPPWEVLQLNEEEWFANIGRGDIAQAQNAAARKRAIADLESSLDEVDQSVASRWAAAQQMSQAERKFASGAGRFPNGAVGKLNLYALVVDHAVASLNPAGRVGMVTPTGIVAKDTYKEFFQQLVGERRMVAFYGFWEIRRFFPGTDDRNPFGLLMLSGSWNPNPARYAFDLRAVEDIDEPGRVFELTADDIRAINPNTRTLPIFHHSRHAAATARIHRDHPVLVRDSSADAAAHNPWQVENLQLFNMASSSGDFIGEDQLRAAGARLLGNVGELPDGRRLLPLYEGKMLWQYDHRYGTYDGQTDNQAGMNVLPHLTAEEHLDPHLGPLPRYWVPAEAVQRQLDAKGWNHDWVVMFRDVGISPRTFIPAVAPAYAAGDKAPLLLPFASPVELFVAVMSSMVVDYALRQKSDKAMKLFVVKQAPVLPPETASQSFLGSTVLDFVSPRVAELVYTAHDVAAFADDIGFSGQPFRWDDQRRPTLQAELDAAMFHLYSLDRPDVETVLDSFTVLAKYEQRDHEEFRTKRLVLERYDAMSAAIRAGQPYATPLSPGPAADQLRHGCVGT